MQTKTLITTLFITLAAAHPSPAGDAPAPGASADATNVAAPNTSSNGGEMSIMAQKTWQAAGGCEVAYRDVNKCLARCIYEADYGPRRCPGWKHMTGVKTGGCVIARNTCQCVCEY